LSNFFSGMFILTDQPFKEGDIVILGDGDWAQVRRIGMRTTRLFRFIDASIITVPNNKLVNEKIANFSNPLDQGRLMKTFNVAYGSDITKVRKIISEAIDASPHILKDEPLKPIIRFDAMSESSLDFFVLVWLDSRDNRFAVTDYLNTEIYKRFNEAGIEIPFPQRTVHVRLENEALSESKTVPLDIERFDNDEKGKQGGRRGKGSS
ncbi:MAG: mechanosensitive ion channel, partial [Candidatus Thermoplasmatota archaeon]|nr:mechanosensitive ion channel [Candidatus Thermoplasmatota archaeon]